MSPKPLKIIFGGSAQILCEGNVYGTNELLKTLEELDIRTIDTAELYLSSEEVLGKVGAAKRGFTIDAKSAGGFSPEPLTASRIIESGKRSLQKLKTDSIDVYYLHVPDRRVPWKETFSGLNELYKQGAFKRLGLSNFLGREVEEVVAVCKENNFVVPSVYQGNYSAIARRAENEIFPVLRKHGIVFHAYSPIAGGFLAKSKATLMQGGRFSGNDQLSQVYNGMYNRPSFVAALDVWEQIAQDEGVARAELAYRWAFYHSKLSGDLGDAVIVGASSITQLRQTTDAIKRGPLSAGAVERISAVWESVKGDALLDNFELATKASG